MNLAMGGFTRTAATRVEIHAHRVLHHAVRGFTR
jgi:hypothetical protein